MIAPAAFSRATAGASFSGTYSLRRTEPLVVRIPAVSIVSLIVIGTPCNGPEGSLACSATFARSNTSGASVTIAFKPGLSLEICSRCASTTSTGDNSRLLINLAIFLKDLFVISVFIGSDHPSNPWFCFSSTSQYNRTCSCTDSLTTYLIATECILGYSFEQDLCLAQAASAYRYSPSRHLSFRTLLH